MARVAFEDTDKYGGKGGAGFFQLKDDGDKARIRFMYNSIEDVVFDTVHEIPVRDDKGEIIMGKYGKPRMRLVNCLRNYDDPVDDCPFCREGKYTLVKLFIPIYNIDENQVQIWERGKTYQKKIGRIVSKHPDTFSDEIMEDFFLPYQLILIFILPKILFYGCLDLIYPAKQVAS